jgi:succinate dehydrogenase / fumarate reductase flavoprotein subunit
MVDMLIIGSGGAALTAALSAKAKGVSVLVVGKQEPTNSQTSMAQGGINGVLDLDMDTIDGHVVDTIKSSRNLSDEVMIERMCQDAPRVIEWLESIGVPFSRYESGAIAQRQLGGATHNRACYSQD